MGQPIADEKPYATFVFNYEGEEYVLRSDYERLRALVPDSRDTLRARWNAMHGVGRWIPVSERLPEEGEPNSILLYLDYRDGYGGQDVGYFLGGNFWLYEDGNITCDKAGVDATHWMPLPEPPEAK